MAGDWIKMRTNIRRHPKVIAMSRHLARNRDFINWWSNPMNVTCRDSVTEIVTFEIVTRVTVSGLLELWGAINTVAKGDLHIPYMAITDLDDITGIPGFGDAMGAVGWVSDISEDSAQGLVFPNFSEFNKPESERKPAKTDAERAKEYRDRKKESSVTDQHKNVTKKSDESHGKSRDIEKRREDIKDKDKPPLPPKGEETKKTKFNASEIDLPVSVDRDNWISWCQFRSSKRKPISEQAAKQQIAMLSGQAPDVQRATVQQSIANDYQGLFPPKGDSYAANQSSRQPVSELDRVNEAISRRAREREAAVSGQRGDADGRGNILEADVGAVRLSVHPPVRS